MGFILVGKVFGKAFRISGLGERKGRWIVEQDFHENFQVKVTWFLSLYPVSLTESCSFCCGLKDCFIVHKIGDNVILDHKTDDITSMGSYG